MNMHLMEHDFKVGDVVKCIANLHGGKIEVNELYEVTALQHGTDIMLDGHKSSYNAKQFQLFQRPLKADAKLIMSYSGLTITLDASIPFSRKFAEVFLNVAYGDERHASK